MHYNIIFSSLTFENDYNKISVVASNAVEAIKKAMQKVKQQATAAGYSVMIDIDCITIIDNNGDVVNEFFNFRID